MKKIFFILAILFVSACSVFAVPAIPWAIEKVQPDGTKISVYLKGDEKVHWMESADGYTLMYDTQQYVVYAQQDAQGNLMPSTIKFGSGAPSANITKGLRYNQAQTNTLMKIGAIAANVASYAPNNTHPQQVYPVCASSATAIPTSTPNSYGTIDGAGCPFPGTSRKTEFSDNSTPQAFTCTNLGGIGNPIINITENSNQTISFGPCINDYTSQTITTNTTITGCTNLNVQNVTVTYNSKLIQNAPGEVNINGPFEVQLGSQLDVKSP